MTLQQRSQRWFASNCWLDPALNALSWVAKCSILRELLRSLHFRPVFRRSKQSAGYVSGFMVMRLTSRRTQHTSANEKLTEPY